MAAGECHQRTGAINTRRLNVAANRLAWHCNCGRHINFQFGDHTILCVRVCYFVRLVNCANYRDAEHDVVAKFWHTFGLALGYFAFDAAKQHVAECVRASSADKCGRYESNSITGTALHTQQHVCVMTVIIANRSAQGQFSALCSRNLRNSPSVDVNLI